MGPWLKNLRPGYFRTFSVCLRADMAVGRKSGARHPCLCFRKARRRGWPGQARPWRKLGHFKRSKLV